ncbi:MAG: WG repeat-containing protein [Actinobacteria bacterium]|nr:WG repeat-containing protein [Actinomycetota bacterium]
MYKIKKPLLTITAAMLFFLASLAVFSCGNGADNNQVGDGQAEDQRTYEENLYGYIDGNGEMVVKPQFDSASSFSEGLASVRVGNKRGYIDRSGEFVIEPQFYNAREFSEGLAAVAAADSGLWGYIDKSGGFVIEPQFIDAKSFHEGRAAVQFKEGVIDRYGYIDNTGRIVAEPQWYNAYDFSEGLAQVWEANTVESPRGFIDQTGEYAIPPELPGIDNFGGRGDFHDGRALVGGDLGYIDNSGKKVIDIEGFDDFERFCEGLAPVEIGGKWGFIDIYGNIVIEPQWDAVSLFSEGIAKVFYFDEDEDAYIDMSGNLLFRARTGSDFHEGLALINDGPKTIVVGEVDESEFRYGYMDTSGNVVIEIQFAEAGEFSEGLAWVRY